MKINYNKFQKITDDLVNRPSVQITSLLGFIFCWAPVVLIQMFLNKTVPGTLEVLATCTIFFIPAVITMTILFIIESIFKKLRAKFGVAKFITLTLAAVYIVMAIITMIILFYLFIKKSLGM